MRSEQWDRTVREAFGDGARIIFPRFFESKKNQVTLLSLDVDGSPLQVVAKYYVWGDADAEWDALNGCSGRQIPSPRPISRAGNVTFMEYIPGRSVKYVLENTPQDFSFAPLGRWLGRFHRAFAREDGTTLQKVDLMPPNFIVSERDGEIYGIDFEECRRGAPLPDLAEMAATGLLAGNPSRELARERNGDFFRAYLQENPVEIDEAGLQELLVDVLKKRAIYMPVQKDAVEEILRELGEPCTNSRIYVREPGK
jgi:hypothetical protein